MKKKCFCLAFMVILVTAFCLLHATQATVLARGRIIYIFGNFDGDEPQASVEPNITTENRQTTIIFLNESQVDVRIIFPEGKTCAQVTRVAPGWNMKGRCYITRDTIPPGRTADIIFNSIGNYDYEVEYIGKNHKEKAQIRISTQPGSSFGRW